MKLFKECLIIFKPDKKMRKNRTFIIRTILFVSLQPCNVADRNSYFNYTLLQQKLLMQVRYHP